MGIFDIFKKRKGGNNTPCPKPAQYLRVQQFNVEFTELLGRDMFIARSDYKYLLNFNCQCNTGESQS